MPLYFDEPGRRADVLSGLTLMIFISSGRSQGARSKLLGVGLNQTDLGETHEHLLSFWFHLNLEREGPEVGRNFQVMGFKTGPCCHCSR